MIAVWKVSERRACHVMKAPRSTQQYKPRRDEQADLKKRIKEIAETRVRYGLQAHSRAASPRRMGDKRETRLSTLSWFKVYFERTCNCVIKHRNGA